MPTLKNYASPNPPARLIRTANEEQTMTPLHQMTAGKLSRGHSRTGDPLKGVLTSSALAFRGDSTVLGGAGNRQRKKLGPHLSILIMRGEYSKGLPDGPNPWLTCGQG